MIILAIALWEFPGRLVGFFCQFSLDSEQQRDRWARLAAHSYRHTHATSNLDGSIFTKLDTGHEAKLYRPCEVKSERGTLHVNT